MTDEPTEPIAVIKNDLREADTCTALGVGVGALGVASALTAGAVCPLCFFIAPGLLAVGVGKRWVTKRKLRHQASFDTESGKES